MQSQNSNRGKEVEYVLKQQGIELPATYEVEKYLKLTIGTICEC